MDLNELREQTLWQSAKCINDTEPRGITVEAILEDKLWQALHDVRERAATGREALLNGKCPHCGKPGVSLILNPRQLGTLPREEDQIGQKYLRRYWYDVRHKVSFQGNPERELQAEGCGYLGEWAFAPPVAEAIQEAIQAVTRVAIQKITRDKPKHTNQ